MKINSFLIMQKWRATDYITFLRCYCNYEILYNVRRKDYTNKPKKIAVFRQLLEALNNEDGKLHDDLITINVYWRKYVALFTNTFIAITDMKLDVLALTKKIKSIEDLVWSEFAKMRASKKTGTEADYIYYPKLQCFPDAEYLGGYMTIRESSSNLVSKNEKCRLICKILINHLFHVLINK